MTLPLVGPLLDNKILILIHVLTVYMVIDCVTSMKRYIWVYKLCDLYESDSSQYIWYIGRVTSMKAIQASIYGI
jgi:hypothetical protein